MRGKHAEKDDFCAWLCGVSVGSSLQRGAPSLRVHSQPPGTLGLADSHGLCSTSSGNYRSVVLKGIIKRVTLNKHRDLWECKHVGCLHNPNLSAIPCRADTSSGRVPSSSAPARGAATRRALLAAKFVRCKAQEAKGHKSYGSVGVSDKSDPVLATAKSQTLPLQTGRCV